MTSGSAGTFSVYGPDIPPGGVCVGLDEVGRGAWAGPVTVGAVVQSPRWEMLLTDSKGGFRDSKMWSERGRQEVFTALRAAGMLFSVGHASPYEIDDLGLNRALALAGRRSLFSLGVVPDALLLDGSCDYFGDIRVRTHVGGDRQFGAMAAASICAKVTRDEIMRELGKRYPQWGFERSKGYGTALHAHTLATYGPLKEHRMSVKPVCELAKVGPEN